MKKICNHCKKEFKTTDKRQKYCGRECYFAGRRKIDNKVTVRCNHCGEKLRRYPSQVLDKVYCNKVCFNEYIEKKHRVKVRCHMCGKSFTKGKYHFDASDRDYCSYECSYKGFSKYLVGEDNPSFLNTYTHCDYCNKKIYRKRAVLANHERSFCTRKCQGKWLSENNCGVNNPRYNPNITESERIAERSIAGYTQWRTLVYERDNYTCQICGDNKGGNLNAHHLNSYKWDKKNRTNIDNGITLCEECHIRYHSLYGRGNNTKEEFNNYIESLSEAL